MTDAGSAAVPGSRDGGSGDDIPGSVDVVVIGGGVAGLVAARQLAHLGQSVLLVEERPVLGGFVARHEVAGIALDAGAESFAVRKGTVAGLATDLGLADDIVTPDAAGAWVTWNGGAAPLPAAGVLGIPGSPLADDVRRILGWGGSLRAYLDRLMPLVRVRAETDLGDIVRRRMGQKVLDRLVTPVVAGVHSADPGVVDVHAVAPGLTQAMTTQGSLSGAVMALREQAPAGSLVQGISGGVYRLVEALEADCRFYGVQISTRTRAATVSRVGQTATAPDATTAAVPDAGASGAVAASWRVELESVPATGVEGGGEPDAADAPAASRTGVAARAVLVATGFRGGLRLLGEIAPEVLPPAGEWPEPASITLATIVVDEPRLDAHPRGTGVLVGEDTPGVAAKALTHSSAKWRWLADALPAHRHVLRLSYGRGHAAGPEVTLAGALDDASTLLGVPLAEASVAGFAVTEWTDSLAFATVGHKARVRRLLAGVDEVPGLDVTGAWVAGTGLAATVEQARAVASGVAAELRGDHRAPRA
ncbi:protoporphyrinogen/coproporphyrinogen oxidase [Herbiconiux sp. YIM B11900]|uniref:protoporphyrinogen/coproporphyrinogen oxidase n=1 Tax=Herbiconiux sp. YIM B11900 TaxID=3404131 RepID=UPI003F8335BD